MANVFDLLPDVLLTIMGLLSLIRIKRFRDAFAAAAAVFGMEEEQLYREVELFIQEHWEEDFAALDVHSRGLQYFGSRPRTGANVDAERVPRRRAARRQPDFRPADVSAIPAHMAAELVAPTTPPYVVRDNKIQCRLAHCGVPDRKFETVAAWRKHVALSKSHLEDECRLVHCGVRDREFETVAAWRKHVALSKSHLEDAFCGTCGYHLIVPPEVGPASVKAFITAHKKERCVGASKATMRQRQTEITRLSGLMRNTSHILVPG
uniref:C2H2-type domain-containing protein n=1 Tax=Ascaris lumbricoides TaxID=6252 RepID=A0A0M3ICA9_ASCLU